MLNLLLSSYFLYLDFELPWRYNLSLLTFTFLFLQYTQSGVLVLLLRVAQEMYPDGSEEVLATLDLFNRLVTFNKVICTIISHMLLLYLYWPNSSICYIWTKEIIPTHLVRVHLL